MILSCKSTYNDFNNMQGNWATSKNENVSFTIKKDSIYYLDYNGKYTITFKNNILEIKEENHLINKYTIVKISKDSLILKTDSNILKYCKITE